MLTNPDIVLFAIQSGIRLNEQIKRAYTDSLKRRELVLPMPNFPSKPDLTSALIFFRHSGREYVQNNSRIAKLMEKNRKKKLTREDEDELCIFHQEIKAIEGARSGDFAGNGLSEEAMTALMTVRQWQRGNDPNPTALQRIAGTVIEIAIDYFVNIPGALNENSGYARALRGFLTAIDDLDFARTFIAKIAERLFVVAIETILNNPDLLYGDENTQNFIKIVTKGMAHDLNERISKVRREGVGDLAREEEISRWGETVFKSLLKNSYETALSNPGKFLNTDEKEMPILVSVGKALMDILIPFSKAHCVLDFEFPPLIRGDRGDQKFNNAQISNNTGVSDILSRLMIDELICLILTKASGNPALINLLINETKKFLETVSPKTNIAKKQIMINLGIILDEAIMSTIGDY